MFPETFESQAGDCHRAIVLLFTDAEGETHKQGFFFQIKNIKRHRADIV